MITIIEVHKLLQSCQVLLFCDEEVLLRKVKLSLTSNGIHLMDSVDSDLCKIIFKEIKIKPNSISGLMIDRNFIVFRVQIESDSNLRTSDNVGMKFKPNVSKNCDINILCACCMTAVCHNVNFKRVLPLPSVEDWNYDDFFCHKHNGCSNSSVDDGTIKSKLKIVSKDDFLYDEYYSFKINSDYISNCKTLGVIHCGKCLSWIGKKTEHYVKLWNSAVIFNTEKFCSDTPLNDFNNTILYKLCNSINPIFKVVITSCITNASVHYVLLRILNKNLTILTNYQKNSDSNVKDKIVQLIEKRVVKVSYYYFKEKNEIVQSWLSDNFIETIEMSKQMLFAGCDSLIKSTNMLAKPYRCIDNMNIGYIGLV